MKKNIAPPSSDVVTFDKDGLMRADGIPVFRILERNGVIYVQFCDHDRMRARCRGSKFVEVPLKSVIERINSNGRTDTTAKR